MRCGSETCTEAAKRSGVSSISTNRCVHARRVGDFALTACAVQGRYRKFSALAQQSCAHPARRPFQTALRELSAASVDFRDGLYVLRP